MDHIEIVAYDAAWPAGFAREAALLRDKLGAGEVLEIEHAGSTAVPGLAAKPIIDIFIAVASVEWARSAFPARLGELGYVFWAENPRRERLFFVKGMPPYGARRTHHVHVLEPANATWQRTLLFRDYLRAHPDEAERYRRLKVDLADTHRTDREAYTRAKDAFVEAVISKVLCA